MILMITTRSLAPGVTLHALKSDKFKTACFSLNFLKPHDRENAALDALLPSVLLRGTEKYPDIRSISSRLDELYGASLGTLVRRKGEVKLTGFYADYIEEAFLPAGETVFGPVVEFLAEVLYRPYLENGGFCPRFVEGEKQNLMNAIASSLNNKRSYAAKRLLEQMCAGEAYAVPRLGDIEDVKAITPQALWAHYQTLIRTARVEIFYGGRLEADTVAAAFAPLFAQGRDYQAQVLETEVPYEVAAVREFSDSLDVNQGKLVMGLRTGFAADSGDYPALLLLNAVYGAGTTSKLFVNVREKLSLCYYASSSIDKYKGLMLISSGIAFENYETAKAAILEEREACRRGEISELELAAARQQILSSLRANEDAPVQLDEFYCGNAILPGPTPRQLAERVRELTLEDLARVAGKLRLDSIYFLKGVEG